MFQIDLVLSHSARYDLIYVTDFWHPPWLTPSKTHHINPRANVINYPMKFSKPLIMIQSWKNVTLINSPSNFCLRLCLGFFFLSRISNSIFITFSISICFVVSIFPCVSVSVYFFLCPCLHLSLCLCLSLSLCLSRVWLSFLRIFHVTNSRDPLFKTSKEVKKKSNCRRELIVQEENNKREVYEYMTTIHPDDSPIGG